MPACEPAGMNQLAQISQRELASQASQRELAGRMQAGALRFYSPAHA